MGKIIFHSVLNVNFRKQAINYQHEYNFFQGGGDEKRQVIVGKYEIKE